MKPFLLSATLLTMAITAHAAPDAFDDFQSYGGLNYGSNGGFGLGPINYLEGNNGGVFLATGGPSIDGGKSMGLFAGGNNADGSGQAAYRSLVTPETLATYSVSARFNVNNNVNFSGFNIKTGVGTTLGGPLELLAFGLTPTTGNNSIGIFDSTGTHTINLGTSQPGLVIDFALTFDTNAGTYTLTAIDRNTSTTGFFTGLLKDTNGAGAGVGAVADLGFGNFNSGPNQDLIIDNISISSLTAIPEPGSAAGGALLLLLAAFIWMKRRPATPVEMPG